MRVNRKAAIVSKVPETMVQLSTGGRQYRDDLRNLARLLIRAIAVRVVSDGGEG